MASQRDAERLTGLQKGGISPLALLDKGFRVFVDETIILHERIEISAGKVGAGVIVPIEGLMRVLDAAHGGFVSVNVSCNERCRADPFGACQDETQIRSRRRW